jgi:hypothetical protein
MIRLLVSQRGPLKKQVASEVGKFESKTLTNFLDKEKKILHNLVSVLQMQRRESGGVRRVRILRLARMFFKN